MIDVRQLIENAQAADQDPFELLLKGDFDGFVGLAGKGNPSHDPATGRFTSGGGGGGQAYPPANSNGKTTQDRFKKEDGAYTKERQALHDSIVDGAFKGKEKATGQAELVLLGGGPGAGKTSVLKSGVSGDTKGHMVAAADDFKKALPEFQSGVKRNDPKAAIIVHKESSDIASQAIARGLSKGHDVVLDGTGNTSIEKVRGVSAQARNAGHKVKAVYVTITTKEALLRAKAREKKTGRGVPDAVILAKHAGVSRIAPKAVKEGLFDSFELWDNSGKAGKQVLVAHASGKNLKIDNSGLWAAFIAKGG